MLEADLDSLKLIHKYGTIIRKHYMNGDNTLKVSMLLEDVENVFSNVTIDFVVDYGDFDATNLEHLKKMFCQLVNLLKNGVLNCPAQIKPSLDKIESDEILWSNGEFDLMESARGTPASGVSSCDEELVTRLPSLGSSGHSSSESQSSSPHLQSSEFERTSESKVSLNTDDNSCCFHFKFSFNNKTVI